MSLNNSIRNSYSESYHDVNGSRLEDSKYDVNEIKDININLKLNVSNNYSNEFQHELKSEDSQHLNEDNTNENKCPRCGSKNGAVKMCQTNQNSSSHNNEICEENQDDCEDEQQNSVIIHDVSEEKIVITSDKEIQVIPESPKEVKYSQNYVDELINNSNLLKEIIKEKDEEIEILSKRFDKCLSDLVKEQDQK